MSIQQAALAAASVFPAQDTDTTEGRLPLRVVMVAIAGAETGGTFDPAAKGDQGLDPVYGLCNGYSSWGLWQIHNVHRAYLARVAGSSSPCAWYAWLSNPTNCARAALAIEGSQGLSAWTTYNDGSWRSYLAEAKAAVAAAAPGQTHTLPLPSAPPGRAPTTTEVLVGVGALAAVAGVVGAFEEPAIARRLGALLYRPWA